MAARKTPKAKTAVKAKPARKPAPKVRKPVAKAAVKKAAAKPAPKRKVASKPAVKKPAHKSPVKAKPAAKANPAPKPVAKAKAAPKPGLRAKPAPKPVAAPPQPNRDDTQAVYAALRNMLMRHAARLRLVSDRPGEITFEAGFAPEWNKILFFGAAAMRKSYVSYYLFPVYVFPELLDTVSPQLRARLDGTRSCFNFDRPEPKLLEELGSLTERGFERFGRAGWLR